MIVLLLEDFNFSLDGAENQNRGYSSFADFKFHVKTLIKIGLILEIAYLHVFFCIFGQRTLDKLVSMEKKKGLSMICRIQNFANIHLGKVTVSR